MNIQHKDKKDTFVLDKITRSFVIGMILGDANINKHGSHHRLLIKHGASQLGYLQWKRKLLDPITSMPLDIFRQKVVNKFYGFGQFVTLTHETFDDLHTVFYKNRTKVIPADIKGFLDVRSLASWIMDDGAKDNVGMTIQTHSFSASEVDCLITALRDKFHLCTNKRKNKGHHIIYIPKDQMVRLWNYVGEFILPEFRYKFPLTL